MLSRGFFSPFQGELWIYLYNNPHTYTQFMSVNSSFKVYMSLVSLMQWG